MVRGEWGKAGKSRRHPRAVLSVKAVGDNGGEGGGNRRIKTIGEAKMPEEGPKHISEGEHGAEMNFFIVYIFV